MADRLVVPSILGPVSVLTTSLRVRGYLSGATVTVMAIQGASSRVVAYGLLVGPEAMMPLVAGVSLRAGELLSASQQIGVLRSESLPPDQLTQVLPSPTQADAGALHLVSTPYACGECLYVEGAYPGASVSLRDSTGWTRGVTFAVGSIARLSFSPGLNQDDLAIHQELGGGAPGPGVPLGEPVRRQATRREAVPPPVPLVGPVTECSSSIAISNILEGAQVEVAHTRAGLSFVPNFETRCVDLPSVAWPAPKMAAGDVIRVRQTLCGDSSDYSDAVTVGKASVPRPYCLTPCPDNAFIIVRSLVPGAEVELRFADSSRVVSDKLLGQAYAETSIFWMAPGTMKPGGTVTVVQRTCGLERIGPEVEIPTYADVQPLDDIEIALAGPLQACASRVRVTGVPRGSHVRIISGMRASSVPFSGCIGETFALAWNGIVDVPVIALRPNDTLWALIDPCRRPVLSRVEAVLPVAHVPAPTVDSATDPGPIRIGGVIQGATVELWADRPSLLGPARRELVASQLCPTTRCAIPLPDSVGVGTRVRARQRACNQLSDFSDPIVVRVGVVTVEGNARRVQQLTGDVDRGTGQPTLNRTAERYELPGMDLGIPLEHLGQLYLLFGDSSRSAKGKNVPFIRPIARVDWVSKTGSLRLSYLMKPGDYSVDAGLSLDVDVVANGGASVSWSADRRAKDLNVSFFVPSGAVSIEGTSYVSVMRKVGLSDSLARQYEREPDTETRSPDQPFDFLFIAGRGVWAMGALPGPSMAVMPIVDVREVMLFPSSFGASDVERLAAGWKFAESSMLVLEPNAYPLMLPQAVLMIWGTGAYRQSDVCFAWVSLQPGAPVPGPSEWNFLTDVTPSGPVFERGKMDRAMGLLQWSDDGVITPKTTFATSDTVAPGLLNGEVSVTYLAESKLWLMMRGGKPPRDGLNDGDYWANYVRVSKTPWGPWLPVDWLRIHADVDGNVARSGLYSANGLQMLYRGAGDGEQIWFDASFIKGEDKDHGQSHLFVATLSVR